MAGLVSKGNRQADQVAGSRPSSSGTNLIGHTLVNPFKHKSWGRSLVNQERLTPETVAHELIHAAGAYATKGFDTGVRPACEAGHAEECRDLLNTILDEVKAAQQEPDGRRHEEPES